MTIATDRTLADHLGMNHRTVQRKCRDGEWPHLRFGRRYRFTPEQVAEIVGMHAVAPKTATPALAWGRKTR